MKTKRMVMPMVANNYCGDCDTLFDYNDLFEWHRKNLIHPVAILSASDFKSSKA